MKLKKWTLAGLAVLLVAGGAPWGVGYVTEQHWREAALEVNRVQPFLNLETEQYRRGVLGSEVSASVTLRDPQTGDRHTIDLEVQVSHGVTGSLMVFRPRQGWQPEGADWFPDEEPSVTLETRIWGSATFELNAPVMTIDDPERESAIHTSGGLIRMDIGRLGDAAELLVVWPVIRLRDRDMDVVVENVHIEQSMEWLAGDIWTGSGAMTVGSLALKAPQAPELLLKGVSLETSSDAGPGGERLDSRMALSLESASMGGPSFGPHRLAVALEDLDVSSWNEFSAAMADMQSLALTAGDDPRVAFEQQMAVMQRFNEALRGLAAGGFSVGVRDFSMVTPEGEVMGAVEVSHPELSGQQRDSMLLVMQGLTGSFNFGMPVALAENYPAVRMQVAPLIKQGLLVQNGERLVMDGRMEDLILTVNDVEIPLPPLL